MAAIVSVIGLVLCGCCCWWSTHCALHHPTRTRLCVVSSGRSYPSRRHTTWDACTALNPHALPSYNKRRGQWKPLQEEDRNIRSDTTINI